jgi:spoIIIJ-associated protein
MSDQPITDSRDAAAMDPNDLGPREQAALQVVQEICDCMDAEIDARPRAWNAPYLEIELFGEDAEAAFGRSGKALDALQYLVNLIVSRQLGASDVRVSLDAADFRARRTETLVGMAREYAALVRERQEECEFDPMPSHERRIIHNALLEEEGITTYSEGEEPERRIVIAPK